LMQWLVKVRLPLLSSPLSPPLSRHPPMLRQLYLKGAGKIIPGLNIAAGAVEVVQGISKSEKQARKDGLKGQEITASKVGGALVDVGY
jgi:hypothetical protein